MLITKEAVDLVKRFEGLELEAYYDPVGVVTIGYGYTNRAGFGPGVKIGDVWTEEKANDMLAQGLNKFGNQIKPMFDIPVKPNEFGAYVSLAYNIGPGAFAKSTTLRRFNAGDKAGAAKAILWFNKAGGKVLRGLVLRREAEQALFLGEIETTKGGNVKPDTPKTAKESTTLKAVAATGVAGAGGMVTAISQLDQTAQYIVLGFAGLAILGLLWIARERIKKLGEGI